MVLLMDGAVERVVADVGLRSRSSSSLGSDRWGRSVQIAGETHTCNYPLLERARDGSGQ